MDEDFVMPLIDEEEEEEEDDEDANRNLAGSGALNIEHELDKFRQQWQKELHLHHATSPSGGSIGVQCGGEVAKPTAELQPSIEEQARYLFMQGVYAEQSSKLYDAIQYYRRAVQLVPDIEFKIEELRARQKDQKQRTGLDGDGSESADEVDDLVSHFQRLRTDNEGLLCQSDLQLEKVHISSLPQEVLMYIFKWVVSSDLDVLSLERLSLVCRGFYECGRDEEMWRLICHRIWGRNCGGAAIYGSYRNMYMQRPHLRFNGVYISKITYYRQGEKSLDNYYKPYHLVEYYRYVRFFPDGEMLMYTSPDDPHTTLLRLKSRNTKVQGLLHGYYKMAGSEVTGVMKRRKTTDYYSMAAYKYRRNQRNQNNNSSDGEQTFHVEFLLKHAGRKPHAQLVWTQYSIHTIYRSSGQETVADLELSNKSYPALVFSRVKHYTAVSESPLQ